MSTPDFRPFIPTPAQNKIAGPTARAHAQARRAGPRGQAMAAAWKAKLDEPFRGITTDGLVVPGLFALGPNGAPAEAMVAAAKALVARLSPEQRAKTCFPVTSEKWRSWQNTELYVEDYGLRLEEVPDALKEAVIDVLRASLSAKGVQMTRDVMRLNRFLGDLVGGPHVLGEWSFIFCLFGEPGPAEPWGWQFFGHHLSLNCLVIGQQMALAPIFWGAEPAYADEGPFKGTVLFEDEERKGLALMRALTPFQQRQAIVAHSMVGGDLPEGRRHFADNLHLGGAFQDNRIIPYEGIRARDFTAEQRKRLVELCACYIAPLPAGPEKARMAEIERHLADTRFCWIGGFDDESPFYYRIQSPVVMIEFDHHGGVFLTNAAPAKFHVHTIVRTPNGNDYGMDLLRLHYKNAPHHR
ncbi:MAG TPA: DUF3500 domain-containing protein [Stellaceae bacterium]|nr:DUF3500 domain-containing protein [Stellaceae bacterium]